MAAMTETTIIIALLCSLVVFFAWLLVRRPSAKHPPVDLVQILINATADYRDRSAQAAEGLVEADMRITKLEAALAFYADEDRWDGQRFVTCAEPWNIAQQAVDGADIDDIIQASSRPPEVEGDEASATAAPRVRPSRAVDASDDLDLDEQDHHG